MLKQVEPSFGFEVHSSQLNGKDASNALKQSAQVNFGSNRIFLGCCFNWSLEGLLTEPCDGKELLGVVGCQTWNPAGCASYLEALVTLGKLVLKGKQYG